MVFGTFDILHPGHESFFRQAKKLGDYLIAVVARDKFVKEKKGWLPRNSEKLRSSRVQKSKLADKVILGSKTHNFYRTIRTYKPSIIALGYDQKPSVTELKKSLKRHRLQNVGIVRLRSYKPEFFKSRFLSNSDG
ncbi:MAG: adenylyltransferase/cytidyltransferase family protein [Candidatus Woykebacteria bacterium]